jgi:ABC-2 type transport system permease protein
VSRLTGTGALVRLVLRRDRVRLPVWVLAQVALTGSSAFAVQGFYDTVEKRAGYAASVGSSGASIAMSGPPVALDELGGITVFEVNLTATVMVALMALFLVVRHTRTDEEAGRTELLRAGVMGRQADLAAVGIVVATASLVVGLLTSVLFLAAGLPASGSLLYGGVVAAVGLFFTGVGLVAAQLAEHGRAAVGMGLAVLGGAFVLRAAGDVSGSWLTWASPLGWGQGARPFGDERVWPLALPVLAALALAALAGWLTTRRDIGGGLVPARPGSPVAGPLLGGPFGLAARLQRTAVLGWCAGMGLLGIAFGSLGRDVEGMVEGNDELAEVFAATSGGASIVDAFFSMVLMIAALIASGFTVSSALRLRSEETALRAEPLLATPVSRRRWALGTLAVTVAGTALVLASTGLGAGLAFAVADADPGHVTALLGATLAYLPAALLLGAVGVLLVGWAPAASGAAWGLLAACVVIGWLGELLQLPAAVMDASPYVRTPQLPAADWSWAPVVVITLLALVAAAAGLAGLRRRDLATG